MTESIPWTDPDWLASAQSWIGLQLERLGMQATGTAEQIHVRPWSTVLRVPTRQGRLYFKACTASLRHEPALTRFLAEQQPDCMLALYGMDSARAWMLVQDGGDTLRSQLHSPKDLPLWEAALRLYAEVQISLAEHSVELLALGTPDRRLQGLTVQFANLLEAGEAQLTAPPHGLTPEEYHRLQASLPDFERACQRLASFGIPTSLHHDDFHDANIYLQAGRYRFADWGESCVTHPFFSLLVNLRSAAYRFGLDERAAQIEQLREAYLQAWTGFAPLADLRQACSLATRLAMVNRALTWHRVLNSIPPDERREYEEAVPGWLQDYIVEIC
jgi:hypothetical protein